MQQGFRRSRARAGERGLGLLPTTIGCEVRGHVGLAEEGLQPLGMVARMALAGPPLGRLVKRGWKAPVRVHKRAGLEET